MSRLTDYSGKEPRRKGAVEMLCEEIKFSFDRRMENWRVHIAFVGELLAEIELQRSIQCHAANMGGPPPSDGSARAIRAAKAMLAAPSPGEAISRAAWVHELCRKLNPDDAYPTDHFIDMVSSCASAVRFGLESPCRSRHAASAASHVWRQAYGISRFDSFTPAWERDWIRAKLCGALAAFVPTEPRLNPEGEL
jgi:hypothetical protein